MPADIVFQSVEATGRDRLRDVQRRRPFEEAVARFVRLLGTVPDCDPNEISDAEVGALQAMAEDVIGRIEARIDAGRDPAAIQQVLAGTVSEISRLWEEVDTWRRHNGLGRSS